MQTLGTPITTTTVPGGESAAVSATSAAPATPFNAVMALMTQIPGESANAASLVPGLAVPPAAMPPSDGIPTVFPPVSPAATDAGLTLPAVSASVVNAAAATDETGFEALMAASALAGRGITARAPAPVLPASPLPPEILPEDFIGPIQPSLLTADAAVPSGAAAQPQDFAAVDGAVDPDFIGPMLPPDHALRLASQMGEETPAAPEGLPLGLPREAAMPIAADRLELGTEPALIEELMVDAATDRLPQDEVLLQREAEVSEFDQPLASAMLASFAPRDDAASAPENKGMADAATANASHVAAMMVSGTKPFAARDAAVAGKEAGADLSAVEDAVATMRTVALVSSDAVSASTPDRVERTVAMVSADALSASAPDRVKRTVAMVSADALSASTPDRADATKPAELDADLPSFDPAMLIFGNAVQQSAAQPSHPENAPVDAERARQQNATPILPSVPPRMMDPAMIAARDAALLQTMTALSQPQRGKTEVRTPMPAAVLPSFPTGTAPLADVLVQAPSDNRAPLSMSHTLSDEARRLDLLVDRLPREMVSASTQRDATGTANVARDADLAAMIHGVSVSGGVGIDQINPAAPAASILPVVTGVTPESATRDAPSIAAIAADGRRDTQRDAEIRERQIKQQVTAAIRAGSQEVRMQLYPPGLGQIIIRIAMDGGKLRLSMKAGTAEAADALTQTETGLRDALARDGFALAGFDVHDDEHQGRNNRDQAGSAPTLNRATEEGEAFSVDMTA